MSARSPLMPNTLERLMQESMRVVEFDGWTAECDPEANRAACGLIGLSGSDACGCVECRNFVAARDAGLVYPSQILELFGALGVDYRREAETWSAGPVFEDRPDLHFYGGWFNVVGRIDEAAPRIGAPIEVGFTLFPVPEGALVDAAFGGAPVFRLEFQVATPWMLDEPYSGR